MHIDDGMLVNVFGHPCVGKSTLVDRIIQHQDGIYTVDFDVIKRQMSGYYWKRDREFAAELARDTLNLVVKSGRPTVCLLPITHNKEEYDFYFDFVNRTEYKVIDIMLTVERNVLIERYKKRLENIRQQNPTFKVKTLDEFLDVLDQPTYMPDSTHVIDSGTLDEGEVYQEFLKILNEK